MSIINSIIILYTLAIIQSLDPILYRVSTIGGSIVYTVSVGPISECPL